MGKFVKPFRAFLYSEKLKDSLSSLICPPYDIINDRMQKELFEKNELNYVRVVLSPYGHKHARETLKEFIKSGVIKQDEGEEKIYVLSQKFFEGGEEKEVLGIFSLVSLNARILQHENVRRKVIEDRIELLRETGFNTCPIFLLTKGTDIKRWFYGIPEGRVRKLFDFSYSSDEYGIDIKGTLFSTDDTSIADEIDGAGEFLIADGHHRYNAIKHVYGEKGEEFFMAYITDENSGIFVLPILREITVDRISERVAELETSGKISEKERFNPSSFEGKELDFLQNLRYDFAFIEDVEKGRSFNFSDEIKNSEKTHIEILHDYILKDIPHSFEHNMREALGKLARREVECVFVPKPLSIREIWEVVEKGRVLPPKSTYFWPKIPSGLLLHRTNFSDIK